MMIDVLNKVMTIVLGEETETFLLRNLEDATLPIKGTGYHLLVVNFKVSQDSYNKRPVLKKLPEGLIVRENPFIHYELTGFIQPSTNDPGLLLEKWILAYHKIISLKSLLKVSIEHPYLEMESVMIDVTRKMSDDDYFNGDQSMRFSLPVTIRLNIKVKEDKPEKIHPVKERKIQFTHQV